MELSEWKRALLAQVDAMNVQLAKELEMPQPGWKLAALLGDHQEALGLLLEREGRQYGPLPRIR